MKRALTSTALLALVAVAGNARAATDYAAQGPEATTTSTLPTAGSGGMTDPGSLVVPNGAGPYPLLVTSHGFSAGSDNQVGWAEHFASYGFVVAVPTFPNTLSPDENVDSTIIETLVATYSDPPASSPAHGKVDGTKIGIEGHSAGGLATSMASVVLSPGATVLFDPVDNGGVGVAAVAKICSPLLEIFSDPSSCNNNEGWDGTHTASLGPQVQFHVVGSTHCDGENHARDLCGPVCGGAAVPARQDVFARYATAFFLASLKADADAKAVLASSALGVDTTISGPKVDDRTVTCGASSTDGGTTTTDGGTSSGSDGGATPNGGDAGTTSDGDTSSGSSSSSGCGCRSTNGDRESASLFGLLAIGLFAVRRRFSRTSR